MRGDVALIKTVWRRRRTLKALANFSPGLGFGNPGHKRLFKKRRNPERVASMVAEIARPIATLSGLRRVFRVLFPG